MEFNVSITEAADASSLRAKDITIGWGEDPNPNYSDFETLQIKVESQYFDDVTLTFSNDSTEWDNFFSDDGLKLLASDFWSGEDDFPDGFYKFIITLIDTEETFDNLEAIESQGFLAWARIKARKLPLPLEYKNLNWKENTDILSINVYLDGAEAAGATGQRELFKDLMDYLNYQFNLKGIKS